MGGRSIPLKGINPFQIRGSDGVEIPGTRLTVSDVPFSVSNRAIETALMKIGLKLRSPLKMEGVRDPQGKLTEWLNGRRFAWIDLPTTQINPELEFGKNKARLYFREMKAYQNCKKCLQKGHTAGQCKNLEVCLKCRREGHRAAECPGLERLINQDYYEEESMGESENKSQNSDMSEEEQTHDDEEGGWNKVEAKRRRRMRGRKQDGKDGHSDHDRQKNNNMFDSLYPADEDASESESEKELDKENEDQPSRSTSKNQIEIEMAKAHGFWPAGTDGEDKGEMPVMEKSQENNHEKQEGEKEKKATDEQGPLEKKDDKEQGNKERTDEESLGGNEQADGEGKATTSEHSKVDTRSSNQHKNHEPLREVATEDNTEVQKRGRNRGKERERENKRMDSPSIKPYFARSSRERERSISKRRVPDTPSQNCQSPAKK